MFPALSSLCDDAMRVVQLKRMHLLIEIAEMMASAWG